MAKAKQQELSIEEKLEQALVPEDEQPYEVPSNWIWTYWGNCGTLTAGSGFKTHMQGFLTYDIPYYKVGSLKYSDNTGYLYLYDAENTISEEMRKSLKASLIPVNSIIFAKIGEAIRLNRRSINSIPCCIDNNLMAFIPKVCNYRYAYYWSCNQEFYDLANATTVPAIRKSDLELIPFPLPPLAEQQRIVDRIEGLFEKLDNAKELCGLIEKIDLMKKAILARALRGELATNDPNEESAIELLKEILAKEV